MLYLDDETRRRLRGIQDGWLEKQAAKKPAQTKARKLNRDKRRHLVDKCAAFMREGKANGRVPTLLNYEAPMRHGLRVRLILEGWGWTDADAAAADIVKTALNQVGAQRPTWEEGQPEYSQQGAGALIERTRCVRCHKPLEGIQRKFCSDLCGLAHHSRLNAITSQADGAAYDYVVGRRRRDWLDEA